MGNTELLGHFIYIVLLLVLYYFFVNKLKEFLKLENEEALQEEERLKELEERVDVISDYLFDKSEKNEKN